MDDHRDPWGREASESNVAGRPSGDEPAWVTEDLAVVRASLVVDISATARDIRAARQEFAAWLAVDVRPDEVVDDLALAVYEALANVVDHAYGDTPGGVRLVAHRAQESLRVVVSDHGRWHRATGSPFRGRGLGVIRLLIEEVHVATDGARTDLHLRSALPAPSGPG